MADTVVTSAVLFARVKSDCKYPIVTAGGGQEFTKKTWNPVAPGTEEEITVNPFLDTTDTPPAPVVPDVTVTPEFPAPDGKTTVELPVDLHGLTRAELLSLAAKVGLKPETNATKGQLIDALEALRPTTGLGSEAKV